MSKGRRTLGRSAHEHARSAPHPHQERTDPAKRSPARPRPQYTEWIVDRPYDEERSTRHPDELVAELAARRHSMLSVYELRTCGLSKDEIHTRVRHRHYRRYHRGVYYIGTGAPSRTGHLRAAPLAIGDDATLAAWDAVEAYGLVVGRHARIVHVAAPRQVRRRDGIRPHYVADLQPTTWNGLPVPPLGQAILQTAAITTVRATERLLNQAEIRHRFYADDLAALIEQARGHAGMRTLAAARQALALSGRTVTRSDLEELALEIFRRAGLPPPRVNLESELEPDFCWPELKLIVEIDSNRYHQTALAFEEDRRRDEQRQLDGWIVLRFTQTRLQTDREGVVRSLRRALAAARRPSPDLLAS